MERYKDLLNQMRYAKPGKECRALHKKLKKYGSGMFILDRYPNLPIWIAIIACAVAVLAFAVRVIQK